MSETREAKVGAVAIGRNEGERLVRCLRSLVGRVEHVIYVDSGSTDGSVAAAEELGAVVVELDTDVPFTAARARNAGFDRLSELIPNLGYVQFVDGDCEIAPGWLDHALAYLESHEDVGVVAGRRRERHPEASAYNRLADMEWDTPIGPATEIGGDALFRVRAFLDAGRYDPTLIAGEDPELCLRVRRAGWQVIRLDQEMTRHDAAMHHFSQWWTRATRAGHAYAENFHMHGGAPEHYRAKELRSILFWGGAVPLAAAGLAPLTLGLSVVGAAAGYGVLTSRIYRYRRQHGDSPGDARLYAAATALGKLAQMRGVARYVANRARGRRGELIEYKG